MHACMYVCTYIHVCMFVRTYVCMRVCTPVHVLVCVIIIHQYADASWPHQTVSQRMQTTLQSTQFRHNGFIHIYKYEHNMDDRGTTMRMQTTLQKTQFRHTAYMHTHEYKHNIHTRQGYDDEDADDTSEDASSGTPSPQASRKLAQGGRTIQQGSRRGSGKNDKGDATMVHADQGDVGVTEAAANRDQSIAGSVRMDVLAALQLVEGAHKVGCACMACVHVTCTYGCMRCIYMHTYINTSHIYEQFVQTVTSNRDKSFSLAQRMRRAKIPLEKILAQGDRADDGLRHAVMDLR
jgi:hypothetical protein